MARERLVSYLTLGGNELRRKKQIYGTKPRKSIGGRQDKEEKKLKKMTTRVIDVFRLLLWVTDE